MVNYIDEYKGRIGVEPICAVLPIASSIYYEHKAQERDPERRSARARSDAELKSDIERVWGRTIAFMAYAKYGANLNEKARK